MKRMLESMLRGPGWFWNHKIRIAVLIMIFTVATPHHGWSQFLDSCCKSIMAGLSSTSSALTGVVRRGLRCIFGDDQDIEMLERTVVWPG
jgi:hypothetical protein